MNLENYVEKIIPIFYGAKNVPQDEIYREPFGDFYVGYCIRVNDKFVAKLTKESVEELSQTHDLRKIAVDNLRKTIDPPTLTLMLDIIMEITESGEPSDINLEEIDSLGVKEMYVLTTKSRINGAVSILCEDTLAKIGELFGTDFYILPSSVHECIILSTEFVKEPEALEEMIKSINEDQVAPEDQLSDSLYIYRREIGKVTPYRDKELEDDNITVEDFDDSVAMF